MKSLFRIFSREKEVSVKPFIPIEEIVFNVDNFNLWFCSDFNNAIYANKGIFGRVDKLSESHIEDYLIKCYNISNYGPLLWSKPTMTIVDEFLDEIKKDWRLHYGS